MRGIPLGGFFLIAEVPIDCQRKDAVTSGHVASCTAHRYRRLSHLHSSSSVALAPDPAARSLIQVDCRLMQGTEQRARRCSRCSGTSASKHTYGHLWARQGAVVSSCVSGRAPPPDYALLLLDASGRLTDWRCVVSSGL